MDFTCSRKWTATGTAWWHCPSFWRLVVQIRTSRPAWQLWTLPSDTHRTRDTHRGPEGITRLGKKNTNRSMLYLNSLDQRRETPQDVSRCPGTVDTRFLRVGCFERRHRVALRILAQRNVLLSGLSRLARRKKLLKKRSRRRRRKQTGWYWAWDFCEL